MYCHLYARVGFFSIPSNMYARNSKIVFGLISTALYEKRPYTCRVLNRTSSFVED